MRKFWLGYWFKNWYFIYKIGYAIVIAGSRTYFKNFKYLGKEKIPKNAGIIFAMNHQNAFLDPIVIAGQTFAPINFLARADIFKNKLAGKLLRQLYLLPIYRQRDGVDTIAKNQKTFEDCYDILKEKRNLIIFPEGNHNFKKNLRTLKKGVSRIALGTMKKYGKNIPLYVVPMGIDYENHFSMNADILINVGDPINISDYYGESVKNSAEATNKLTTRVEDKLKDLLINISDSENYNDIYYLLHKFPLKSKKVEEKFFERKNLLNKINALKESHFNKYEELISDVEKVKSFVTKHKLRPYLFTKPTISLFKFSLVSLMLTILLPFHLFMLTTNYLPYKIPVWFVENKIKDKHFHSSLKMALGVLFFFIYWFLLLLIILMSMGWKFTLLSAVLLPVFAKINFNYWIQFIKIKGAWNYRKATKKKEFINAKIAFENIKKTLEF